MVGLQTGVLTPERRQALLELASRHGVKNLRVFATRFLRFSREAGDLLGLPSTSSLPTASTSASTPASSARRDPSDEGRGLLAHIDRAIGEIRGTPPA